MKNTDCLSPQIFYSTFIPDRDEGESWEKDETAEGDTVTGKIIQKLYMGKCCLFNPRLRASQHIPILMEVHRLSWPLGVVFWVGIGSAAHSPPLRTHFCLCRNLFSLLYVTP